MELGPLARLLIELLSRCPSIGSIKLDTTRSSRPAEVRSYKLDTTPDPDPLSADLQDPHFRSYYIKHLEAASPCPAASNDDTAPHSATSSDAIPHP